MISSAYKSESLGHSYLPFTNHGIIVEVNMEAFSVLPGVSRALSALCWEGYVYSSPISIIDSDTRLIIGTHRSRILEMVFLHQFVRNLVCLNMISKAL